MSSIITIIESVVNDLDSKPSFFYGQKGWVNLKADKPEFPAVMLIEPITSSDTFHQGGMVDSDYDVYMLFLDDSPLDDTPEQKRVVVDAMRALRREFILKLKLVKDSSRTHVFKSITNVRTTDTYNELDRNASGVGVSFTATPLNGDSVCT